MSEQRRFVYPSAVPGVRFRRWTAACALAVLSLPFTGGMAIAEPETKGGAASADAAPLPELFLRSNMGSLHEFDAMSPLPTTANSARFVLGDSHGFLHVYEQHGDAFQEIWVSEFLESAVGGVFVLDVDGDELAEIIAYTETGSIHFLDVADYRTLWSNPPDEYESLSAVAIHNIDDDDQQELLLCADGRLVVYDGRDRFEEWRSDQTELATVEIVVADVDGDGSDEIVLNDGFVFDAAFLDLEWQSPVAFGLRIASFDIDNDAIPEIIGEMKGNRLRIFDVDLRLEKSSRR